ncbi:hypothetical protein [Streptomyces sp. JV180]|uniref:hypothetical protein n=1 Tax=Streptomyces sp. JV180 TaxID=858634 RepID=UPI00168AEFF0|nr:hypothetical protein [Streptomyces sp. JV180]MBD3550003.1 hypothetical protein [Streptomyces sp. JV180]
MTSIASTLGAPRAGLADDMTRDDDARGPERDETDRFQQLVQQLVVDGDDRAASAGRQAARTLQQMAPGYVRQPVLILHRPVTGEQRPPRVTALNDQERKDLSDKVGKQNERSENPYPK